MIVDASALIAVLLKEPGYEVFLRKLALAAEIGIGTPTLLETFLVLSARLNFGDCMAYATAKLAERPLLFVGNDFTQTDLEPA